MNVKLVKLAQADLPMLTKLLNRPEIAKWLFREDLYRREWQIEEVLAEAKPGTATQAFGIYWSNGGGTDLPQSVGGDSTGDGVWSIVGCICLQDIDGYSRAATIGNLAAFHPYQAIAAGREIIRYGFNTLNLNRIDCRLIEGCRLTQLMLKKIGGTEEGILRQVIYQNGEYKNVHIWSLLREDWDGKSSTA